MSLFGGNDQELNVTIKAKDEASADIAKVNASVGNLAKGVAIGTVAVDVLRAGFHLLAGVVTDSLDEFKQYNSAVAQMNAVLASTQHAAGFTTAELVHMAKALSDVTLYQDDQIISAQNLLLTFTNIGGDVFPRATKAILDMSTALGQDLSSSAVQLGKALNNPIEGISALQRVGVTFSNSQQDLITSMVKTGQTVEAQDYILQELEREFGKSATSAYEAASSITKLEKNITDLHQDIGSGLTPALNSMFASFQLATSGMKGNADVGLLVFRTFSTIEEAAFGLIHAIDTIGTTFVVTGSYLVQFASVVGIATKAGREGFDDFREAALDANKNFEAIQTDMETRNKKIADSWGDVTDAASSFKAVGPAAYQATAAEADAANKKINDTKRAILDATGQFEDFQNKIKGDDTDAAKAFVDQQKKVSDLRKQIAGEDDPTRRAELNDELTKENAALERARPQFASDPLVADQQRRAGLTDFERTLEDIGDRRTASIRDDLPRILLNVNFNDVVAGDDGVMKIIQQTIAVLNRQTTLTTVAGR